MSKLKPTDKQKEALGDALRHARDSVGLTQEELAELLDCSSRWVQKLEGPKSNPNWFTLLQLRALLGIDLCELDKKLGLVALEGAL